MGAWTFIALYLAGFAISATFRTQSDFVIYRNAGACAAAGRPIYDFQDPSPFQYAPIYAVAFVPLSLIRPRWARFSWFLISMAMALPATILGAGRLLFGREIKLSAELIVIPVLLCVRFIHPNFDHGQINLLLLAALIWGLCFAEESKPLRAGALLSASLLIKPIGLPVILYLLCRKRIACVISVVCFAAAFLWLPSLYLGTRPAFGQTMDYVRSLSARTPILHLSHDLHNKYDQSAAAVAIRLLGTGTESAGRLNQSIRAATGFGFQVVLAILVAVCVSRRWTTVTEQQARLSLAGLFCVVPAIQPVSWLEYYVALVVPYMALTFFAFSTENTNRSRVGMARLILVACLILNFSTRLSVAPLYYGVPYLSSLVVLGTVLMLTRPFAVGIPVPAPSQNLSASRAADRDV